MTACGSNGSAVKMSAGDPFPNKSLGRFDYVVVGAGPSAMGLLLGLLQQEQRPCHAGDDENDDTGDPKVSRSNKMPSTTTIALVERGGSGTDEASSANTVRPLHRWCAASHQPNTSNSIHRAHCMNYRVMDVSIGSGLGGTSLINAGLVIPPAAADFSHSWPIGSDLVMKSVETILSTMHTNNCIAHSTDHAQSTGIVQTPLPIVQNYIRDDMWKETTFPSCCTQVPCAANQSKDGVLQRASYYESLLQPLLEKHPALKERLSIFTGFCAERLLFQGTKCTGVEVLSAITGLHQEVYAAREVIVCTGAIESPALLLASGIGKNADLRKIGVTLVVSNFPGHVGGNLRDHILLPRVILTRPIRRKQALNGVRAIANIIIEPTDKENTSKKATRAQILLMDSAAYSDLVPLMVASAFRFYVDPASNCFPAELEPFINLMLRCFYRSFKLLLTILVVYTPVYFLLRYCVAVMAVFLMSAESVGKISVKRKKNLKAVDALRRSDLVVDIELGYLSQSDDMLCMMEAWKSSDTAYPKLGVEIFPGPFIRSVAAGGGRELNKRRFAIFARAMVLPYLHWMGTCAMQKTTNEDDDDDEWVVDCNFRVRGVQSLRVCDASVFPTLVSSPPALTCAALGHILAFKLEPSKT